MQLRRALMFGSVLAGVGFSGSVLAQTAAAPIMPTGPIVVPPTGSAGTATPTQQEIRIKKIKVLYRQLLLKEKNVSAAVSEITKKQIEDSKVTGSIQSILKQTPSVASYQQSIGQSVPELTVRGIRTSQLAETLDGVPFQDLLYGGHGNFLSNNVGSSVTVGQISNVKIYPGAAPPDRQGFATLGGTIAYKTTQPTPKFYADLFGGIGSYDTANAGFDFNTGKIGTGPDAPMVYMRYNQEYTNGYTQGTDARYSDFIWAATKPYDDGLSKLTATVIYNNDDGYVEAAATPTNLIQSNGLYYNYPHSLSFYRQHNRFLTAILGDQTYINQHAIASAKLFLIRTNETTNSYVNPSIISPSAYQPNYYVPFYEYGGAIGGPGSTYYQPGSFTYNPVTTFGSTIAGETADESFTHTNTIGFTPKVNLFFGVNDITVGGLIAKENSGGSNYVYGSDPMPLIPGYNSLGLGGGSQRTVYSAYAQDRINLLHNKLHIEPGVSGTLAYTSSITPINFPEGTPGSKLQNFGRVISPYLGVSYDLPDHLVAYANYGTSARFAPISDYSGGAAGSSTSAPHPSYLESYNAGMRYDTSKFYMNVDAYYQTTRDNFGLYENVLANIYQYSNDGAQDSKGIELSTKFRLSPSTLVFGNVSYNQSRYLKGSEADDTPFQEQFGYAYSNTPLSSVPNWLANFGAEYTHDNFYVRGYGQYTGEQYTTYDISPTNPNPLLDAATTTNTNFQLPGYLTLNLYLRYRIPVHYKSVKYVQLSLNAQNLLGLHYFSHYYQEYVAYAGIYQGNPYASAFAGPPRLVTFELSTHFG